MVLKPQRFSINPRVSTRIPKTNETREGGGKRPSPLSLQPKASPGELCLFKVNSTIMSPRETSPQLLPSLPPSRGTPHILPSPWSALTNKNISCSIRQLCGRHSAPGLRFRWLEPGPLLSQSCGLGWKGVNISFPLPVKSVAWRQRRKM